MDRRVPVREVPYRGINVGDKVIVVTNCTGSPSVCPGIYVGMNSQGGVVCEVLDPLYTLWDLVNDVPYDYNKEKLEFGSYPVRADGSKWSSWYQYKTDLDAYRDKLGCYNKVTGVSRRRTHLQNNEIYPINFFKDVLVQFM